MKRIMGSLVSPNQAALVSNRQIQDSIAIANEVFHHLNGKKRGRNIPKLAIKMDISKTYDSVEWHFLAATMIQMGFDRRWVGLIMQCVSMVSL